MNKFVYAGLGVLAAVAIAGFVFTRTMQNNTPPPSNGQQNINTESQDVQPVGGDLVQIEEIVVAGNEYSFSPATVTLKKGTTYRITFKNTGNAMHNYIVSDLGISTATVSPGESASMNVTPEKAGMFNVVCGVGNHEELGMVGKVVVE